MSAWRAVGVDALAGIVILLVVCVTIFWLVYAGALSPDAALAGVATATVVISLVVLYRRK